MSERLRYIKHGIILTSLLIIFGATLASNPEINTIVNATPSSILKIYAGQIYKANTDSETLYYTYRYSYFGGETVEVEHWKYVTGINSISINSINHEFQVREGDDVMIGNQLYRVTKLTHSWVQMELVK